jgi:hypothetical protein
MFGLLDDIDRQDVKDFLNSTVDNTADLYDTLTEYDYSNMFDDIGDYFRGLLSDEPASPMSSQMGAAFGSRGRGRPRPQAITKTTVEVSPGRPRLMDVLQSANAMGPKPRTGRQGVARNYRRDYPEYVSLRELDPPSSTAAMTRMMRSEYPFNRPQMMEDIPLMKRVSPERRQLAAFASRNPGGMRNAPDYGSEMAEVQRAKAYGLISPEAGDFLAGQADQMANKYFDRLRGF